MLRGNETPIKGGLAHIRSVYSSLAPAEQKVADYILRNHQTVIYSSVTQLAEESGVGESTVIRFCQNAGFRGYQELKLILARDLVEPAEDIQEGIDASDSLEIVARKVGWANTKVIEDTLKVLRISDLASTVDHILAADRIQFFGVGASGVTALDGKYRFLRLGLRVDAFTDTHMQAMSAAILGEKDLVIGISHSGSTKDVVDAVHRAKERGAKIACITAHMRSPLARTADFRLLTASLETPLGSGSLRSKIAQLHILDLLYTATALKMGQKGRHFTELTAEAVLDKLY